MFCACTETLSQHCEKYCYKYSLRGSNLWSWQFTYRHFEIVRVFEFDHNFYF